MPPKAKGGKGSGPSADDDSAEVPVESEEVLSGDSVQALATALNENITHQRELHTTLGEALTALLDRPTPAPMAPMDHDAFATALAPSLARAVDRASGPKKIDPGRPGTEPFRPFSRPVFKPLPAAAEVKESEVFDINQFDPQLRRDNLQRVLYYLELRTNDHARHVVDHIVAHLEQTSLDLLPGYMTYVPWKGEIAAINTNTTMTLLGQAGGGNLNFIPAGTVGERPPVQPDGGNHTEMDPWFDKYWQSQVAMHTVADRTVFLQSLRRTVEQAVRRMFRMLHTYEPFQLPLVPINTNPPPGRAGHISTDGFILPAVAAAGVTPSYTDHGELWNGKKGRRHTEEQIWAYASAVRGFHTWFARAMTQIEIELFAGIQRLFKGPELTRSLEIFRYHHHDISAYKLETVGVLHARPARSALPARHAAGESQSVAHRHRQQRRLVRVGGSVVPHQAVLPARPSSCHSAVHEAVQVCAHTQRGPIHERQA